MSINPKESVPNFPTSDLNGIEDVSPVPDDDLFNQREFARFDRQSMETLQNRDNIYTKILSCYNNYVSTVLNKNSRYQSWFFAISIAILVLTPIQFIVVLIIFGKSGDLIPILTSGLETISALLIFPKIIAEYLFNTDETTNINGIVSTIQNYDLNIRSGIRHTVENGTSEKSNDN